MSEVNDVEDAMKLGNEILQALRELKKDIEIEMEGPEKVKALIPIINAMDLVFENLTKLISLKYKVGKGGQDYANISTLKIPHRGRGRPPIVKIIDTQPNE